MLKPLKKIKSFSIFAFANGFSGAITFLMFPVYAKILGANDFGVISLLESYQMIFGFFLLTWMFHSFYSFYNLAKTQEEKKEILSCCFLWALLISVFLIIFSIFSPTVSSLVVGSPDFYLFIVVYNLSIIADFIFDLMSGLFVSEGRAARYAINKILLTFLRHSVLIYLLLFLNMGIFGYAIGLLISKIFIFAFLLPQVKHFNLVPKKRYFSKKIFVKMLKFGLPLLFILMNRWVLFALDRFFIKYYGSLDDVGIYSVAYKFILILEIGFFLPFMQVWEPSVFKSFVENKMMAYKKVMSDFKIFFNILFVILLGLILFIPDVYRLCFGETSNYMNGITPFYFIAIAYLFRGVGWFLYIFFKLNKSSKYTFNMLVITIFSNVLLNYLLIPRFGILGAAIATCISEICMLALIIFYSSEEYRKTVNIFQRNYLLLTASLILLACLSACDNLGIISLHLNLFYKLAIFLPVAFYFAFSLTKNQGINYENSIST